jgi:hypothetical protein
MLDVHPAHHAAATWRDFLIHIATIVIGLLIAVGLEQGVEALHHSHQRRDLTEQMRGEAERNITVIDGTLAALAAQTEYVEALQAAFASGDVVGNGVTIGPVRKPTASPTLLLSPSRGTWATAQAAGLVALLPAEQGKLYARLDYNADEQVRGEDAMVAQLGLFVSEAARSGYDNNSTVPCHLTLTQRGDLLFRIDQLKESMENLTFRLVIMRGADQAIADGVRTLDEMYAYQTRELAKLSSNGAIGRFYQPRYSAKPNGGKQ